MRKKGVFVAFLVCFLPVHVLAGLAYLGVDAPSWSGQNRTTFQSWAFDTSANPVEADDGYSSPGVPILGVTGPFGQTVHMPTDGVHQGIWRTEDEFLLFLPNYVGGQEKEIWMQVVYKATGEIVMALPEGNQSAYVFMNEIESVPLDDDYIKATYEVILIPNPSFEEIWIIPQDCSLYINEIVVETICIPEPVTIGLFGFGALAMLRRKK